MEDYLVYYIMICLIYNDCLYNLVENMIINRDMKINKFFLLLLLKVVFINFFN